MFQQVPISVQAVAATMSDVGLVLGFGVGASGVEQVDQVTLGEVVTQDRAVAGVLPLAGRVGCALGCQQGLDV
ncbi:hypothetical protein [Streptomyces canus]|uniref:hypothetical protein n=1 Tax=Streptomyces canus TaxID=58343 RepID=UPI003827F75C